MSCFTIYQDNHADTTSVSNLFIDEFMKDANDAQLKIYLYLLRMMSAHLATSISDIADKFNHTEKDVIRSLKYWEKNKLLSLEYNESKGLTGVHMLDIRPDRTDHSSAGNTSVVLAPVVPLSLKQEAAAPLAALTEEISVAENSVFEKPIYSLDELKEFKNNEETSQILFVTEQYLGKTLSPSEIKTILFFSDKLSFSADLIDYLIQYCVEKGKKDFRYIEKVAVSWAEEGFTTPRQAAKFAHKYDKAVYEIMKALGKNSSPTPAEAAFTTKWIKEFGFTREVIAEACDRTVMATDKHRFEYADSILTNWHVGNVHHKSDIKALDDAYAKNKPAGKNSTTVAAKRFNQFPQNKYDYDALEKEILSN